MRIFYIFRYLEGVLCTLLVRVCAFSAFTVVFCRLNCRRCDEAICVDNDNKGRTNITLSASLNNNNSRFSALYAMCRTVHIDQQCNNGRVDAAPETTFRICNVLHKYLLSAPSVGTAPRYRLHFERLFLLNSSSN